VLWGKIYAFLPGVPTASPLAVIPPGQEPFTTCRREVVLNPGDQVTMELKKRHWFQAGPQGAIAYEVSSHAFDRYDQTANKALRARGYKNREDHR
jgi:D-lyxose ketol-isomerase